MCYQGYIFYRDSEIFTLPLFEADSFGALALWNMFFPAHNILYLSELYTATHITLNMTCLAMPSKRSVSVSAKMTFPLLEPGCVSKACFRFSWIKSYWVPQQLPQICTVILSICIGKVAWFAVYICANIWNALYFKGIDPYTIWNNFKNLATFDAKMFNIFLQILAFILRLKFLLTSIECC